MTVQLIAALVSGALIGAFAFVPMIRRLDPRPPLVKWHYQIALTIAFSVLFVAPYFIGQALVETADDRATATENVVERAIVFLAYVVSFAVAVGLRQRTWHGDPRGGSEKS